VDRPRDRQSGAVQQTQQLELMRGGVRVSAQVRVAVLAYDQGLPGSAGPLDLDGADFGRRAACQVTDSQQPDGRIDVAQEEPEGSCIGRHKPIMPECLLAGSSTLCRMGTGEAA
jgi:hypothetical protein